MPANIKLTKEELIKEIIDLIFEAMSCLSYSRWDEFSIGLERLKATNFNVSQFQLVTQEKVIQLDYRFYDFVMNRMKLLMLLIENSNKKSLVLKVFPNKTFKLNLSDTLEHKY